MNASRSRRRPPPPPQVLAFAMAATVLGVLPVFLVGGLAVEIRRDVPFSAADLGLLVATFFAVSSLFSMPGGWISERVGPSGGIFVGALAGCICSIGMVTSAPSLRYMTLWMAIAGLGNGVTQPACNLALTRFVRPGRQGLAFGLKQSSAPTATLLAGLAVPAIALTAGWRFAYVGSAAAAMLLCLCVIIRPLEVEQVAQRRQVRPRASGQRPLIYLAIAGGLAAGAGNSLAAFLVVSSVEAGASHAAAAMAFALGSACGIAARIVLGHVADGRQKAALSTVLSMMVLGSAGFGALAVADSGWLRLLATLLAFGAGWGWPGLFVLAIVRAYPSAPAAATGVSQTGVYLGCVLGPLGFGMLVNLASYQVAWIATAGTLLVAAALLSRVASSLRPDRGEP